MNLTIPRLSYNPLDLNIHSQSRVFILGRNGSGKSALIQHFMTSDRSGRVKRISAQRQTWFDSGSVTITPAQRKQYENNFRQHDRQNEALWREYNPAGRQSAILFDLVAKENARARMIAARVDDRDSEGALTLSLQTRSTFDQINEILKLGTLNVTLENSNDQEIIATNSTNGATYNIAQMSDGERNAVIIAANVLTAESDSVLLIDEPERHLHRSIIEPFLTALFETRKDCAFVISTHEVWLPVANPDATVLLVRSCRWNGQSVIDWDVDQLESNADLPEDLKHAILGSRRVILFTEGTSTSGDLALYDALFPNISVVPKEGCENVIRAVHGLRGSENVHHARAFGLIDRDSRESAEVNKLAEDRIYALDVYAVESIYFCSDAIAAVAERQAESLGLDVDDLIADALLAGFEALNEPNVVENFAAVRSAATMRNDVIKQLPTTKSIRNGTTHKAKIDVASTYQDEIARINRMVANRELDAIVERYPIRKSKMCGNITNALELKSMKSYEQTLITQIRSDPNLATALKSRIDPLVHALEDALIESDPRTS